MSVSSTVPISGNHFEANWPAASGKLTLNKLMTVGSGREIVKYPVILDVVPSVPEGFSTPEILATALICPWFCNPGIKEAAAILVISIIGPDTVKRSC
jgi:hypothetical protein